jgi:hypothetical protein
LATDTDPLELIGVSAMVIRVQSQNTVKSIDSQPSAPIIQDSLQIFELENGRRFRFIMQPATGR